MDLEQFKNKVLQRRRTAQAENRDGEIIMRTLVAAVLLIAVGIGILAYIWYPRVSFSASLFTGAEQYQNFYRTDDLFPSTRLPAAKNPATLTHGNQLLLPESFTFDGLSVSTQEFLTRTDTAALLVLIDGKIAFEEYWLTGGREEQWLSMSVAKSFISALIGIAIDEGYIGSVADPITQYVPQLSGSAYDGVRIKDILQMSSGAAWNEDYSDPNSDINRFSRVFALGGSINEFAASLQNENLPGSFNRYNSMDTQALGMLLTATTGTSVTEYMKSKLWQPLRAEYEAFWIVDSNDMEMVFAGLNATARDYAKFGELYRQGGESNGQQLVPRAWVVESITPDAPHLLPGENPLSDFPLGYGYQWWIPDLESGDFSAIGVYNQFIYVSPATGMVVVKLSANSDYGTSPVYSSDSEFESIAFFKALAEKSLSGSQ